MCRMSFFFSFKITFHNFNPNPNTVRDVSQDLRPGFFHTGASDNQALTVFLMNSVSRIKSITKFDIFDDESNCV